MNMFARLQRTCGEVVWPMQRLIRSNNVCVGFVWKVNALSGFGVRRNLKNGTDVHREKNARLTERCKPLRRGLDACLVRMWSRLHSWQYLGMAEGPDQNNHERYVLLEPERYGGPAQKGKQDALPLSKGVYGEPDEAVSWLPSWSEEYVATAISEPADNDRDDNDEWGWLDMSYWLKPHLWRLAAEEKEDFEDPWTPKRYTPSRWEPLPRSAEDYRMQELESRRQLRSAVARMMPGDVMNSAIRSRDINRPEVVQRELPSLVPPSFDDQEFESRSHSRPSLRAKQQQQQDEALILPKNTRTNRHIFIPIVLASEKSDPEEEAEE